MYYFYAIESLKNGTVYKGISIDPYRRLVQHNSGRTQSTKPGIPYRIVYVEECSDIKEARQKEVFYKSGAGRTILKKLLGK
jgi:putative endonuclease